jgi:hypothetical protein
MLSLEVIDMLDWLLVIASVVLLVTLLIYVMWLSERGRRDEAGPKHSQLSGEDRTEEERRPAA